MEDGSEKPVAFSSRTLSPAEKKYSQLEKEGLAIVFAMKKFHDYLFGRKFTIFSDHRPLQHIFSGYRPVSPLASARIQKWALMLSANEYAISYKPGEQHANVDALSRLPLPEMPLEVPQPAVIVLMMDTLQGSPVRAANIRQWTDRDPTLSIVRTLLLQGWQDVPGEDMRPYTSRKHELSVQDGCVLWGSRVIVPQAGHAKLLDELHDGHPGITIE